MQNENKNSYSSLENVLKQAFDQASQGKGSIRHSYSDNEKFENQVLCEIARRLTPRDFSAPLYQSVKKIYESTRLELDDAEKELLGAINYIAAAIILIQEKKLKINKI